MSEADRLGPRLAQAVPFVGIQPGGGAGLGQRVGDRPAQPAGAAGDQRDLAVEAEPRQGAVSHRPRSRP